MQIQELKANIIWQKSPKTPFYLHKPYPQKRE